MSKLKLDSRHGYEGCVCDESGPIIAHVTTAQDTDLAAEIVAAVNFCRANNIDPSAADPLAGYRERIADHVVAVCGPSLALTTFGTAVIRDAIMAAPAPKETK